MSKNQKQFSAAKKTSANHGQFAFPSPTMLESYEEAVPGLINKLEQLTAQEQLHRHTTERLKVKYLAVSFNLANIFFFTSFAAIFILVSYINFLVLPYSVFAAICFSLFNFIALFYLIYVTKKKLIAPLNFELVRAQNTANDQNLKNFGLNNENK